MLQGTVEVLKCCCSPLGRPAASLAIAELIAMTCVFAEITVALLWHVVPQQATCPS